MKRILNIHSLRRREKLETRRLEAENRLPAVVFTTNCIGKILLQFYKLR